MCNLGSRYIPLDLRDHAIDLHLILCCWLERSHKLAYKLLPKNLCQVCLWSKFIFFEDFLFKNKNYSSYKLVWDGVQDSLHIERDHLDKFFIGAKPNYWIWKLLNNIQKIKFWLSFTKCLQAWIIKTLINIVAPQSSKFCFEISLLLTMQVRCISWNPTCNLLVKSKLYTWPNHIHLLMILWHAKCIVHSECIFVHEKC
jgi:hypothetical protein